ncbi:MAG TPA: hypothetical protein DCY82_14420 [Acidimicrobiaceae bacterium]|nr:hypothetical protein [Acidimicrobiaceae bacterium]
MVTRIRIHPGWTDGEQSALRSLRCVANAATAPKYHNPMSAPSKPSNLSALKSEPNQVWQLNSVQAVLRDRLAR